MSQISIGNIFPYHAFVIKFIDERLRKKQFCVILFYSRNRDTPSLCDPPGLSSHWVVRATASPATFAKEFPLCHLFDVYLLSA